MTDLSRARIVLDVALGAGVRRDLRVVSLGEGEASMAIYRPTTARADQLLPTVLFVHGDAAGEDLPNALDWGQYQSWGEAVAARGLCAVVLRHRSSDGLRLAEALVAELLAVIVRLREHAIAGVDADRLGIWTCSAGSFFGVTAGLKAEPPVACIVTLYGLLDVPRYAAALDPASASILAAISPTAVVERAHRMPPTLIVKAALDDPELNESIDHFAAAAASHGDVRIEVHPAGHHAFDVLDDDATSAALITLTLDFIKSKLTS